MQTHTILAVALLTFSGAVSHAAEALTLTDLEPAPPGRLSNASVLGVQGTRGFVEAQEADEAEIQLSLVDEPVSAALLSAGDPVPWTYDRETATATLALPESVERPCVVAVEWKSTRWDERMAQFAEQDKNEPPREGGIVFTGSSTVVGWDLERCFPGFNALNRGFGGSLYSEAVHYFDKILLPYRPATIVLYSGDNDIAMGKSPEHVFRDFQALVTKIRHYLPEPRIIVLATKPSASRWDVWPAMKASNALIEAYADTQPDMTFVDISAPLLGDDGMPREDYYKEDRLHLTEAGYDAVSALLRPLLAAPEE